MDPNSGKLYSSVDDAKKAGVKDPVEVIGHLRDIERMSRAVSDLHAREQKTKKTRSSDLTKSQQKARSKKNKATKASRRANRK